MFLLQYLSFTTFLRVRHQFRGLLDSPDYLQLNCFHLWIILIVESRSFQQLQLSRSLFLDSSVKDIQRLVAKQDYSQLERTLEDPHVENVIDVNGGELATDPGTVQSGGTLLHEAARKKDMKLIQLLLMHGADPFRRDRKGKLPQDVTKDDKTRGILKKSPAAAAAQRGIQEKAVLGSGDATDGTPGGKDSREMKGYLKKWTNYTSGYKLRWFVLEDGVMSYYKHQGMLFGDLLMSIRLMIYHR